MPEEDVNLQIAQGENSGVVLTLKTDKSVYKPDDTITVSFTLENKRDKAIYRIGSGGDSYLIEPSVTVTYPSNEEHKIWPMTPGLDWITQRSLDSGDKIEGNASYTRWVYHVENAIPKVLKKSIENAKPPKVGRYILTAKTDFEFEDNWGDSDNPPSPPPNADGYIEVKCCFYITEDGKVPS